MSVEKRRDQSLNASEQPASSAFARPLTEPDPQRQGIIAGAGTVSVSQDREGDVQQNAATPIESEADQSENHTVSPERDGKPEFIKSTYTDKQKKLFWRLLLFVLATVLCGQAALVSFSTSFFNGTLVPKIHQAAEAVSHAMTDRVRYATAELGIPIDKLVGLEHFMAGLLDSADGVSYMILQQTPNAEILAHVGLSDDMLEQLKPNLPSTIDEPVLIEKGSNFNNISFKIIDDESNSALLHVGLDETYLSEVFNRILYDTFIISVITFLIAIRLLAFFIEANIAEPLQRIRLVFKENARGLLANRFILDIRDEIGELYHTLNRILNGLAHHYEDLDFETKEASRAQIDNAVSDKIEAQCNVVKKRYNFSDGAEVNFQSEAKIYLPLFLFILSEEILRPFIPLLINERNPLIPESAANLATSIPIAFYMIAILIVLMLGYRLTKYLSSQSLYMAGVIVSITGYVASFYTNGYYDLFLCRFLSGFGYGFIFLAGQIWLIENTIKENYRIRGATVFIIVLLVASLCGPPIGGLIVSKIGLDKAFLISALLTLISGIVFYINLGNKSNTKGKKRYRWTVLESKEWSMALSSFRFITFVLLCMMPMRFLLTGLLFFIVPLYLNQLGSNVLDIGKTIMLYSLAPILLSLFAMKIIEKYKIQMLFNTIGNIIPFIGCIIFSLLSTMFINQENLVAILLLIIGFGYSLSLNAQPYIFERIVREVSVITDKQSVMNTYQLIEYIGFSISAIIGGILATILHYTTVILIIGSISFVGIVAYQIITFTLDRSKKRSDYVLSIEQPQQAQTN